MISVVLIAHDQQDYVAESVSSVLEQDYPDLELICIDDGSTDHTWSVLTEAGKRAHRPCRVRFQSNRGPAAARNLGASWAQGDLLLFLDGDDLLAPNYLSRTAPEMLPGISVVYTDTERFGAFSDVVRNGPWDALPWRNPIPVCSLIRAEAFREVGGYREEEGMFADWGLWTELHHRGLRAAHVPEPLWRYRQHEGAWSSRVAPAERARLRALVMANHPGAFA